MNFSNASYINFFHYMTCNKQIICIVQISSQLINGFNNPAALILVHIQLMLCFFRLMTPQHLELLSISGYFWYIEWISREDIWLRLVSCLLDLFEFEELIESDLTPLESNRQFTSCFGGSIIGKCCRLVLKCKL